MSKREVPNWLDGFRYYTSESECPDNYLTWTALAILSSATQRNLFTRWIYYKFFPNIFVLLVGPPGIVHKSAAIRFARKMLFDAGVPTASEAITKEALIQQMTRRGGGGNCALAVTASEFASFIRPSGGNMVEFLTDIYDCDDNWEYTTKGGGTARVETPFLSLLGGVVPEWFASSELDANFISGGFASRTIFIREDKPRFKRADVNITPKMLIMREKLVRDLQHIMDLEGEFVWDPDGKDWFNNWYEQKWDPSNTHLDYRLKGYLARKPTHILRLSMLLSIAETDELVIRRDHFRTAKDLLEGLEDRMAQTFSAVGRNPVSGDLERIAEELRSNGGLTRGEIISRNHHALTNQELDGILSNLLAMGVVKMEIKAGKQWYMPNE